MDESSLLKEIETLKSRVEKLESEKKSNVSLFGRSYSLLGSSTSDLILQTKGQVKVKWGNKYIDLIKDGALNVKSSFISKVASFDKIGTSDGIYVVDDGSIYLVCDSSPINIVGEVGNTYISFLAELETSADLKLMALENIGFYYKSLEDVKEVLNGLIYIESEQKLYLVKGGILSTFTIDSGYSSSSSLVIIAKSDNNTGALVIKGTGKSNSLVLDSTYLYVDNDILTIDSTSGTVFNVYGNPVLTLNSNGLSSDATISANTFQAYDGNGFKLYMDGGISYLNVDYLTVNRSLTNKDSSSSSSDSETISGLRETAIKQDYSNSTYWVSISNDNIYEKAYTSAGVIVTEDNGAVDTSTVNPWDNPSYWNLYPTLCKTWFEILWREYIYSSTYDSNTEAIKDSIYSTDSGWTISTDSVCIRNSKYLMFDSISSEVLTNNNRVYVYTPFKVITKNYSIDGYISYTVGLFERDDQPILEDASNGDNEKKINCTYLANIKGFDITSGVPVTSFLPQITITEFKAIYRNLNSDKAYQVFGSLDSYTVTEYDDLITISVEPESGENKDTEEEIKENLE